MVFVNALEPVLLSLGPFSVRWYGLMYVLAFVLAYWYLHRRVKSKKVDLSTGELDSLFFWAIIGGLIGARLFSVFVWNWSYYLVKPLEILFIWQGGLSFHGGLIGGVIAVLVLAKKLKKSLPVLLDFLVLPYALGQAFGRVGNFFNHELYGKITSLPWGVNFNGELDLLGNLVFRHPTQLYEVIYDLIIFGILYAFRDKGLRHGTLTALFLIIYAVFRFLTEFLRATEPLFGPLTPAQWMNIIMVIVAVLWLWRSHKKNKKNEV